MEEGELPMKKKARTIEARSYQLEVLERARKENVIVYLGTGTGKTHIAVMLINSVEAKLTLPDQKRIVVFLAPTVHLVIQQARVVSEFTELKVGKFYGEVGVDTWSISDWQNEFNSYNIFVMTPQVFLNALSTSALKMETVELLIIDECHHAQKKHPYALIMKTHYHTSLESKPKIFGMTASPVIQKALSSNFHCDAALQALENILDAKVFTLEGRSDVEEFAPSPTQTTVYYKKPSHSYEYLAVRLSQARDRFPAQLDLSSPLTVLTEKLRNKISKSVGTIHSSVEYCLLNLGVSSAILAVKTLLKEKQAVSMTWKPVSSSEERQIKSTYKHKFLELVSSILDEFIGQAPDAATQDMYSAENQGLITPKALVLIKLLAKYRDAERMRCIVFVERVIVSVVLAKLISRFLPSVPCDYMSGSNHHCSRTPNQQQEILDQFSSGQLNLLVATSVAEEGLDVQKCSSVIRFDVSLTMRSNVQSRGRARRAASKYIWLLERGNLEQEKHLRDLVGSENLMREEVKIRSSMEISREAPELGDLEIFRVESGACRTTEDSVSFIYKYCAKLPGDSYYTPKPVFKFREAGCNTQHFICTLKLPPNAPLQRVEGSLKRTMELAKKEACLEATKQLLEIGAIRGDTLCPDMMDVDEEDEVMPKDPSGIPDLCFSAKPRVFNASWLRNEGEVELQMYSISFSQSRQYAKLALLIECVLDEEILSSEMMLYSRSLEFKASVHHIGQTQLKPNQVQAAKAFHELIFNASFRRMGLREACGPHWDESEAYLLLPLNDGDGSIDWESVSSAGEALNFLCSGSGFSEKDCSATSKCLVTAGGEVPASLFLNSIVVAVHSQQLYCVTGILDHLNSESLLSDARCSYIDYYKRKYGVDLRYTKQQLFKAKPTHNFHNNLQRIVVSGEENRDERLQVRSFVELPPELCLFTGLSSTLMNSLYLLPSFMHRLKSLIRAFQLRETTPFASAPRIPLPKFLEALTSKKCQEPFSLESLELLGDSFAKYSVTRRLFLVYSGKHEGQLSARRSRATCNLTFNQLAKRLGISEYIRNELFSPACWVVPGMYTPQQLRCGHDTSKLTSCSKEDLLRGECIQGHRYISWKVLADAVEAIIGAYLVSGGEEQALEVMNLMNIEVTYDQSLVASARSRSLPFDVSPSLLSLEEKLGYNFENKSLLLEAITHASVADASLCYQRLEFLGDGALDFLVSRHLFEAHPGLPPGKLTDLRSAAVNNDCFARVVVKHGLYKYLQYDSDKLDAQVREFVESSKDEPTYGFDGPSGPKVLADVLESLAGAVLVDSGFDLEKMWEVMKPLLWPIVTPETLPLHPVRELKELCGKDNCELVWDDSQKMILARVRIREREFVETSRQANKKEAKKAVSRKLLLTLESHGLRHPQKKPKPANSSHLSQAQAVTNELQTSLALTERDCEQANESSPQTWLKPCSNSMTNDSRSEPLADTPLRATPQVTEVAQVESNVSRFYSSAGFISDISSFLHDVCTKSRQRPSQTVEEIVSTAMAQLQSELTGFQPAATPSEVPDMQPNNTFTIPQPATPSASTEPPPAMQPNTSFTTTEPVPQAMSFSELPVSISSKIGYPGGPRSFLYELSCQKKWGRPMFDADFIGPPHSRLFRGRVSIMLCDSSLVQEEGGEYMRDKKKAMDDVSKRMLHRLVGMGLLR